MTYKAYVHSVSLVTEDDYETQPEDTSDNYLGLPEEDVQLYLEQDRQEREAFNRGEWIYQGVYAEAEIRFSTGLGWTQGATLRTPGTWGYQSNDPTPAAKEYGDEQLAELSDMLEALGLTFDRTVVREVSKP